MDKNTIKILKFFTSHPTEMYSVSYVSRIFPKLLTKDISEVISYLYSNEYLRRISNNLYQATNKGKTYISVNRSNWISKHIIETLSLIVSFIALIVSIIALIRTFLTSN